MNYEKMNKLVMSGRIAFLIEDQEQYTKTKNILINIFGVGDKYELDFDIDFPYMFANHGIIDGATNQERFDKIYESIEDFLTGGSDKTLKLNHEYTAVVSKENVKVGCQKFSHETILKLAEMVKEFA